MIKPILAFDIATTTGWAARDTDGNVRSGIFINAPAGDEPEGARYVRYENKIFEMIATHKPLLIVYEDVEFIGAGMMQARLYFGFRSMLVAACSRKGVKCLGVPVSKNKILATDRGNADKRMMIEAARRHFPSQLIKDDNQADALNLLRYGQFHSDGGLLREIDAAHARAKDRRKESEKTKRAEKRTNSNQQTLSFK